MSPPSIARRVAGRRALARRSDQERRDQGARVPAAVAGSGGGGESRQRDASVVDAADGDSDPEANGRRPRGHCPGMSRVWLFALPSHCVTLCPLPPRAVVCVVAVVSVCADGAAACRRAGQAAVRAGAAAAGAGARQPQGDAAPRSRSACVRRAGVVHRPAALRFHPRAADDGASASRLSSHCARRHVTGLARRVCPCVRVNVSCERVGMCDVQMATQDAPEVRICVVLGIAAMAENLAKMPATAESRRQFNEIVDLMWTLVFDGCEADVGEGILHGGNQSLMSLQWDIKRGSRVVLAVMLRVLPVVVSVRRPSRRSVASLASHACAAGDPGSMGAPTGQLLEQARASSSRHAEGNVPVRVTAAGVSHRRRQRPCSWLRSLTVRRCSFVCGDNGGCGGCGRVVQWCGRQRQHVVARRAQRHLPRRWHDGLWQEADVHGVAPEQVRVMPCGALPVW
jgi:hypothetical protein